MHGHDSLPVDPVDVASPSSRFSDKGALLERSSDSFAAAHHHVRAQAQSSQTPFIDSFCRLRVVNYAGDPQGSLVFVRTEDLTWFNMV